MRRRRYEVTEMYALIEISNQMLEDSAFDHAGRHSGRPALRPSTKCSSVPRCGRGATPALRP